MRIAFSFGTAFLATSLLASACIQGDDDDIWMPPGGDGKSDGITKIPGSTIPSQFVDQSKQYLTGRRIDSLQQVGALTGDELAIAMRADGIIANLPANGRLEAAELARMEVPAIFATLFPDEQAALPRVWPLLEAPGAPQGVPASGPTVYTPALTPPSGLVYPTISISTLDSSLQTVARRVQLVFNADSTASTIQIADVEAVLAMPQAFTPAEVTNLEAIVAVFKARATSNCDARVVVPDPGITTTHVTAGGMAIDYQNDVVIEETRYATPTQWNGDMQLVVIPSATVTSPAADRVIVIELGTSAEAVLTGGSSALPDHGGGEIVLERYHNGGRVESHALAVHAYHAGGSSAEMRRFLDYTLVTANGTTLVKNPVAHLNGMVTFHHEKVSASSSVPAAALQAVETPPLQLPVGHYAINFGNSRMDIDLYPQGVVMGTMEHGALPFGFTVWDSAKVFGTTEDGRFIWYAPATQQACIREHSSQTCVRVTAAMRTK